MLGTRAGSERGFEGVSPEVAGDAGATGLPTTQLVVEGLPLVLHVGWTSHERALPRAMSVDLALDVSYDGSGDLAGTVDVDEVVRVVQKFSGQEYRLLEEVAESLAQRLLEGFPRLRGVRVAVRKPHPPVGAAVAATGAIVVRRRDG